MAGQFLLQQCRRQLDAWLFRDSPPESSNSQPIKSLPSPSWPPSNRWARAAWCFRAGDKTLFRQGLTEPGIAAISLLVGGIGIMNIMLVSVTERTREIGVRKALGAKRGDILLQFVVEAILLTGGGGLLGIVFGYGCSRLLNGIPIGEESLQTSFSPDIALLALGVSAAIGLFFGIFPAYRASKLHPIEALRHQ